MEIQRYEDADPVLQGGLCCELSETAEGGSISGNELVARGRSGSSDRQAVGYAEKQPIERHILLNPCCPLRNIVHSQKWLNTPWLRNVRGGSPLLNDIIDLIESELSYWDVGRFVEFYHMPGCDPTWASGRVHLSEYYLDPEESLEVATKLLEEQYSNDNLLIIEFLTMVYNVTNRSECVRKRNCIVIQGPPCSGKTFFVDMVASFFLCRGNMRNINKNESFPFQDCYNKRILVWDEPNYERGALETLKMLFAGDTCSVSVKYRQDQAISCTPVFVTTNSFLSFQGLPSFSTRIAQYHWREVPFLKKITKRLYPMTFYDLLIKYKII